MIEAVLTDLFSGEPQALELGLAFLYSSEKPSTSLTDGLSATDQRLMRTLWTPEHQPHGPCS
jgi:hypothetical protein